jgi:alanyl-tRNA synthetase
VPIGRRMASREIRDAFLAFYADRGHARRPSAGLVPDDPTILLTIAGMVPFKPVFMGAEPAPAPPRATSCQKCIRTNDIENVGVTKRHHTFFEMLGNFSFGDYFKRQAIEWSWELLTEVYEIPPERLAVSVFEDDEEALSIWRDVVGVSDARIRRMGAADNFWASGPTGPCGPCSEIYYDFDPLSRASVDLEDDDRFIELYNLVFMQYSRGADGELTPLETKNIDTGMGLERMAQVLQRVDSNYETDLIRPIMDRVAEIAGVAYDTAAAKGQVSLKVAGDHIRAVAHLVSDGVRTSNIGRGYIVRRLIRRTVRHGRLLGIDGPFIADVLPVVARLAAEAGLDAVPAKLDEIAAEVRREEERFLLTLERGEARLGEALAAGTVSGADAFELYDTFGFPLELTEEIAAERGITVDRAAFEVCMDGQRTRARAARRSGALDVEAAAVLAEVAAAAGETAFVGHGRTSVLATSVTGVVLESSGAAGVVAERGDRVRLVLKETPFYAEGGGQVGDTGVISTVDGAAVVRVEDTRRESGAHVHVGEVVSGSVAFGAEVRADVDAAARRRIQAHHTATHLLQSALREVIPDGGVSQAGSLVDADRLRFDFNCPRAVSDAELVRVEQVVNSWIAAGHATVVETMPIAEARARGAVAMFGEKYGDEVRVVDVPGVSMELCGGTHVENTADIGLFKVVSESGPSSGVRRIDAVCGAAVLPYLTVRDDAVKQLCSALKARPEELPDRVSALQDELRAKTKELDAVRAQVAVARTLALADGAEVRGQGKYVVALVEGEVSADSLKVAAERLGQRLGDDGAVVLASAGGGKVSFVGSVGKNLQKGARLHAGKLVGAVAKVCGGGGGGRPNLAQAGGRDPSRIGDALQTARALLEDALA